MRRSGRPRCRGRCPWRGAGRDRGSGSVLVVSVLAAAALLAFAVAMLGQAVAVRHRAQAAADLAALAAASSWPVPDCAAGARVAAANGALLTGCRAGVDGSVDVAVVVARGVALRGVGPARATARAGQPGQSSQSSQPGGPVAVRPVRSRGPVNLAARRPGRRPAAGPRRPCPAARCRCRTWATGRRTGSRTRTRSRRSRPGWPAARSTRTRKPRSANPAPPGWPSWTKTVGSPVSGCRAVDTPPMSQRSQVATSGSRPIAACSAACAAPGDAGRLDPGGGQHAAPGRSTRRRRRAASAAGRSSGSSPSTRPRRTSPAQERHHLRGHLDRAERELDLAPGLLLAHVQDPDVGRAPGPGWSPRSPVGSTRACRSSDPAAGPATSCP